MLEFNLQELSNPQEKEYLITKPCKILECFSLMLQFQHLQHLLSLSYCIQLSQTFIVLFSLCSSPSIFSKKINSKAHWRSMVFLLSIIRLLDHIFSWHLVHWFMNYFATLSA